MSCFSRLFLAARSSVALLLAALLFSGCASLFGSSEDDYDVDQGEIASLALPSTRDLAHHPDSLAHLDLVEKKGRLAFELDDSYRQMLLEWTSSAPGGVRAYFRTHATLWSKELSLASLIPERGINTLSEDLAREMIAERTAEYDSVLQIDVYLFASPRRRGFDLGDLRLDTPGRRVYLRDEEDNTYEPVRVESSAPLEAYRAGQRSLYGRNAVFFERRTEDGRDLLDAEQLRLYMRPSGAYFTWVFPENESAVASTRE